MPHAGSDRVVEEGTQERAHLVRASDRQDGLLWPRHGSLARNKDGETVREDVLGNERTHRYVRFDGDLSSETA